MVAAAAREAPAPQAAGASLAAAAADTCWPGRPPIRGAQGWGACGGGAGAPVGLPVGEAVRARACAGAGGARRAGSSEAPRRAGGTRREGRGASGGGGAGAARARGGDPRPFLGSSQRRSAVQGPRPGSPQARPQVTPIFEVRFSCPLPLSPRVRDPPRPRSDASPESGVGLALPVRPLALRSVGALPPEPHQSRCGASPKTALLHFTVPGYLKSP